jgi:tetratricopeptide (TPR) repeat protein/CHAT domain-containing protein
MAQIRDRGGIGVGARAGRAEWARERAKEIAMEFKRDIAKIALRLRRQLVCLIVIIAASLPSATAQAGPREEFTALYQQGVEYAQRGDYENAAKSLERARKLYENVFGPDHPGLSSLLSDLGNVYALQASYAEAESVFRRALSIKEKAHSAADPEVPTILGSLANVYLFQGRYAEAESLYKRALAIREKLLGPDHPDVAGSLTSLAALYGRQGRFADSEPLNKRALQIKEKALGPNHRDVALVLDNLAKDYGGLGRYDEAEPLFKRALAIREEALGPDHPELAVSLTSLAILYRTQGLYAEAEPLYKRVLTIEERALGPDHPDVASSLVNLASLYSDQAGYAEAEPLYKHALAIQEKALGPNHPNVASSLNSLAIVYFQEGRYAEAEPLYRRALAIFEKAMGPDSFTVADSLSILAAVYEQQGRYAEVERLQKRALAIREKSLGPDHPDVASSLDNLANVYRYQGRAIDAEPLLKRAVAIREKAFGPDHSMVAVGLENLGDAYNDQGRFAEAEALYKRALAIWEKALGPDHPNIASALNNLATLYVRQGLYAEAEPLYKRAIAIREKALGPIHPNVALSLNDLAYLYDRQDRATDALDASRRAVAILIARIAQDSGERSNGNSGAQQSTRPTFLQLIHLLSRAPSTAKGPTPEIVDEAFRAAQYAGGIETAQALAGMAARAAAGSDALAALVRDRQDRANRWHALDAALLKALLQSPDKRNPNAEAALRKEQAEVEAKLQADDERLRTKFPRFAELAAARPVGVADIQNVLGPQEAFVMWTLADKESYLFAIRKDRATFLKIDMTRSQAAEAVTTLRASLVNASPVDIAKSHDLYQRLLAPAESLVVDAKHLIIVPDGALQSLPPAVLVTALPTGTKASDYKSVAWLIRRQALTVLPAASSLVSLRRFDEARHAQVAFIGFGDPDFHGDGSARGVARGIDTSNLFSGAEADIERLRGLPRLQETADELRAQAKAFGAPGSSVHLGAEASVTNVKRLDLSDTRVVAFATHGLIAGDLPTLAEPALALSPPKNPTPDDDGLLRASQVSQLKLNADFVVLSACNTAAPDGKPGAEGLSGLAKAFFYAGARSLLVSHWPVDSDATVKLTTGLFRALAADPSIGRAEALRRSILALIDDAPDNSEAAHPFAWAPFVLAGEGGADR